MTWPPRTAEELERLCADDQLSENHAIDFKQQVGDGKGARKQFAANLASFATDGGWLIVGFAEDETASPRFTPAPLDLAGQRERIDGIAHTLIDPPLFVTVEELERGSNSGYLLVRIPPSPHVVHQVDGRYYGRRDSQKAPLHDGDVQRLIRLRDAQHASIETTLAGELEHTPQVAADAYWTLLVRAEPQSPQLWPLRDFLSDGNQQELAQLARQADEVAGQTYASIRKRPITELLDSWWQRRPRGVASSSPGITHSRTLDPDDVVRYLELVVSDSGAIQVWYAERHQNPDVRYDGFLCDHEVVGITASVIALAGRLAGEFGQAGFPGQWGVGLRIDGTYGLAPAKRLNKLTMSNAIYPDKRPYVATTTFSTAQANSDLAGPTGELVKPYLRVIRTEDDFAETASAEHQP